MTKRSIDLCSSFCECAAWTWSFLRDGLITRITPSEETITETNLIELRKRHPNQVWTEKFPHHKEKRTGADWELWLGSPSGWLALRVQAKKLDPVSLTYKELDYPNGTGRQLRTLMKNAARRRLIPMYCFYNYWNPDPSIPWNCKTYPKRSQELQGCMIASADHVKICVAARARDLRSIAKKALPWNCLVCCEGYSDIPNPDLTQRASGLLRKFWNLTPEIFPKPPRYVKAIVEGRYVEEPPDDVLRVVIVKQDRRDYS